ncbi:response regulator, partial [Desulfovibrio sp. OttesenSCG-928-O18]|nr:response regulator [Desulfovibrio sp. OttesenSCG-928-O18]
GKVRIMAAVLICLGGALTAILCFLLIRLYKQKESADAKSQSKSSFLARVSHEIRTPMNAIMGMSELILRDAESIPHKTYNHALGIKQAGLNLLAIINDLLDLSRAESGKLEVTPAPYMLASLINDVVNIIRVRAEEKGLLFSAFVESAIPNNLVGDEVRVRQILLNLLSNAVKYTPQGFISLSVAKAAQEGDTVTLAVTVADSGTGIKPEDRERLFGDFVRVDTDRNRFIEGTGLGLAIARNLVWQMGGSISVASDYGHGSAFSVTLPQQWLTGSKFASVSDPETKRVLVYGRTPLYCESLAATLADLGAPCRTVASRDDFLKNLRSGNFQFLFIEDLVAEAVLDETGDESQVVLFTASMKGAGMGNYRNIIMPAHALSVANVLNNIPDTAGYRDEKDAVWRFTAPEARVLVVDDIPTNLRVAEGLLLPYGMQMDFCLSGQEALELVARNAYDLILMDHMMPGMDGIEATGRIRALDGGRYENLPVIALTANAVAGMKEVFLAGDMQDFLPKPVDPAKLDAVLYRWLPKEKRVASRTGELPVSGNAFAGHDVAGIDLRAAVKRFGGDEQAYLPVARSFVTHTPPVVAAMRAALASENLVDYAIAVHGIKGSSAGLGAASLAAQAETLEFAARAGDVQTLQAGTDPFIGAVETLIRNLAEFLKAFADPAVKEARPAPDRERLQALLAACAAYDMPAMTAILAELERFVYESEQELVVWLREQVDTLEYDRVRERLTAALETPQDGVRP